MRAITKAMVLAASMAVGAAAWAEECARVHMDHTITADNTTLTLNGMGRGEARWAHPGTLPTIVVGLYVEHTSRDGRAIVAANERKRLVFSGSRLTVDQFVGALELALAAAGLWAQTHFTAEATTLLDRMQALLRGVNPGQDWTFTYLPGTGLEVRVAGTARGVIAGDGPARAFFLAWLRSERSATEGTLNERLIQGLLGGTCE